MLKAPHTWLTRLLLTSLLVAGGSGNAVALPAAECPMAAEMHHHNAPHADSGCINDAGVTACDECPLCPLHSLTLITVVVPESPDYFPSIIKTLYLPPEYEYLVRLELPPPKPHLG